MPEPHAEMGAEKKHELRDVNVRGVLVFGAALAVLCGVSAVLLAGLFRALEGREADIKKSRFPLAADQRGQLPPTPRLEGVQKLVDEGPRPRAKPHANDFDRRIRQAMQELEGKLPARQKPAKAGEETWKRSNEGGGKR